MDMLKADQLKKVASSMNTYSNDVDRIKNILIRNINSVCLDGRDNNNSSMINSVMRIARETSELSSMLKIVELDIKNVSHELLKVTQK